MMEEMLYADIVIIICSTFIFITGIVGNAFIAAVIISRKKMRTVTNWFVLNLAICNLIIVLYIIPMNQVIPYMTWPFGPTACKYMVPIMEHFAGVCVLTHTCLSVARYIVIRNVMHGQLITLNHVRIVIAAVWIVPFLTMSATVMGLMGDARTYTNFSKTVCYISFYTFWHRIGYRIMAFSLTYVIPMTASGFSYYKINSMVSDSMKHLDGHVSETLLNKRRHQSRRMNRVLVTMYIAFGITTLPIQIYFVVKDTQYLDLNTYAIQVIFKICLTLFYAQVVTNPLVLFYMGEEYRKEVYKLRFCFCTPKLQRKLSMYGSSISTHVWNHRRSTNASNRSFRTKKNSKSNIKVVQKKPSLSNDSAITGDVYNVQNSFKSQHNNLHFEPTSSQCLYFDDNQIERTDNLENRNEILNVDRRSESNPGTNVNISSDDLPKHVHPEEANNEGENSEVEHLRTQKSKINNDSMSDEKEFLPPQLDTFKLSSQSNFITSTPKHVDFNALKPRRLNDTYDGVRTNEDLSKLSGPMTPGKMKLSAYYDDGTLMYFYDSIIGRVSFSSDDGRETDL